MSEENQRRLVLEELDRILDSAAFRGSKRSQDFLRYVVTNTLEGRSEQLKERLIGSEVFERPVDYSTGDDSIVRVKAGDIRKRLAQYYRESGGERDVQIELPPGSYVPEFRFGAPGPPPPARPRVWFLPAAALAVLALAGAVFFWTRQGEPLNDFWQPVFRSGRPVLLCVAHPAVYRITGSSRDLFQSGNPPPEAQVPVADITRDPDHFVGVGDALALAQLSTFFARAGKPAQARIGTDVSFTDLRNSPVVLIGAFTNQWTMQVLSDLRFVFDRSGGGIRIKDQVNASQGWEYRPTTPPSDYAIVSRVFDSKTGDMVISAAGLSHFGTQVAGEFLTNPALFGQAVRDAPPDWRARNLQLVLRAEVIGQTPGPPKVLASWYW